MPLLHSGSDSAFKTNLHTLFHEVGRSPHVKNRSQALAIAYATKRRAKGYADGGGLIPVNWPNPGDAAGQFQNYNAMGSPYQSAIPLPALSAMDNTAPVAPVPPPPSSPSMPGAPPAANAQPPPGLGPARPGLPPGSWRPPSSPPMPGAPPAAASPPPPGLGQPRPGLPTPAAAWGGAGRGFAFGGAPAPWQVRAEARSMMHSGPIISAIPGRTDRHNMSLASGSYVIPSQAVSHLGQNNTLAGMKVLNGMFGGGGPFGSGATMKMGHGAGAPKPPPIGKFAAGGHDRGGARGDVPQGIIDAIGGGKFRVRENKPVEVVTAGGEYVVPPHVVAAIGGGDVKHGHDILDRWVNKLKEDHIRTLKKLPGPAKS